MSMYISVCVCVRALKRGGVEWGGCVDGASRSGS